MAIQNVSTSSVHDTELASISRNRRLAMMLQNNMMDGCSGWVAALLGPIVGARRYDKRQIMEWNYGVIF